MVVKFIDFRKAFHAVQVHNVTGNVRWTRVTRVLGTRSAIMEMPWKKTCLEIKYLGTFWGTTQKQVLEGAVTS